MSSSSDNNNLRLVLGNPFPLMQEDADLEQAQKFLDVFEKHGFKQIDTAAGYGAGEKTFGRLKAAQKGWLIDTKIKSFEPHIHEPEKVLASWKTSEERLGTDKVHILYLHSPDRTTPFEDTLRTMNELYKQGKFEKFGISNYTAEETQQIIDIVTKNGWVRPTVYQGNYNLLVRGGEEALFPLLRKEKIAFYAWSPLAGGFLTGRWTTKEQLQQSESTHFTGMYGAVFTGLFARDSFFEALHDFVAVAKKHNFTPAEVAVRWLAHHSQINVANGDAIILGASRPEQFEQSIQDAKRGPLPQDVLDTINKIWEKVQKDAPPYHY
eukprot:TRINITY_DN10457_c0_g1_i1.p1 TRINITY_DN10457_c0_g1~~TRINITY_DN10457_c0_g1_i1.p1  ORF type:complete len:323 (-),score=96.99 TRINITY_DN10457_c0_g1_i1:75-1043(-)